MENFFSKNIRFIREAKGIKQDAFEVIGIKKGTYSNYEIGKTEPNINVLINISKFLRIELGALINVDLSSLPQKELLKYIDEEKENAKANAKVNAKASSEIQNSEKENAKINITSILKTGNTSTEMALNKVDCVNVSLPDLLDNESPLCIPFYDLPVSAGSLGILDMEVANTTVPTGYVQMPVFRGCEAVFPIIGISMEPLIHSGDWIGVKTIDNLSRSWDFIQTGVVYLIITREDRMIKFIEKSDDEDFVVCSSPNYNSFKVYKADILNIYRVKAIARGM